MGAPRLALLLLVAGCGAGAGTTDISGVYQASTHDQDNAGCGPGSTENRSMK